DRARAEHMSGRRVPAALLALVLLLCAAGAVPGAGTGAGTARAAEARASLPEIEREVMCVTCKIPLNVAQSPQADRERAFIQSLIDDGRDETEIKDALVAQYGHTALALPSDSGFDVTVYLVPLAAFLALLAALAVLLPRWRRHARVHARSGAPAPALSTADAQRLDADLERFD
ncbi:MAG TPA: cytochrome c-type biogenesis protein CcmH, partial [Solirubrobacteraceae bacterium]